VVLLQPGAPVCGGVKVVEGFGCFHSFKLKEILVVRCQRHVQIDFVCIQIIEIKIAH
jgi:hypothetical protein